MYDFTKKLAQRIMGSMLTERQTPEIHWTYLCHIPAPMQPPELIKPSKTLLAIPQDIHQ